MASIEFPCPNCSLPLRARDRSVAGRTLTCPDCNTELQIEAEGDGTLFARERVIEPTISETIAVSEAKTRSLGSRKSLLGGAAILLVIAIAAIFLFNRDDQNGHVVRDKTTSPEPAIPEKPEVVILPDGTAAALLVDQYDSQAGQVGAFAKENDRFPAQIADPKLKPAESLSWIAVLEAYANPDQLPPLWDRPWNDPLNDRFVRRGLSHFLNPAFPKKTSQDRYPATHFVGLAGVGSESPQAPLSNPQAGMFGWSRTVTPDDVTDGLANTMLVTGISSEFGAWAAGATPTIRPFTAPPLIGGPDHFGTGSPDVLVVLMADGSVKEISANTDLDVIKKLIAIGDETDAPEVVVQPKSDPVGVPPQPKVSAFAEWEPLVAEKPRDAVITMLLQNIENNLPPEEKPEPVDVERQLAQKLSLFEMPKSLPLQTVLDEFSRMSRVPIVIESKNLGVSATRLQLGVKISLVEPSLKEILDKLVADAGLSYRVEEGAIVLLPQARD